jgi:hypothetical protein
MSFELTFNPSTSRASTWSFEVAAVLRAVELCNDIRPLLGRERDPRLRIGAGLRRSGDKWRRDGSDNGEAKGSP